MHDAPSPMVYATEAIDFQTTFSARTAMKASRSTHRDERRHEAELEREREELFRP
jgi:hypothetical protein